MKITVDTNFLISSTQWDYSVAHKLLKKLIREDIEIFSTKEILEEFLGILIRDFNYKDIEAEEIVNKLLMFLELVEPEIKVEVIKEDLDDNKIIECALTSNSEYVLTYDNHLLKIKEFRGIKIVTPEEFLKVLEK